MNIINSIQNVYLTSRDTLTSSTTKQQLQSIENVSIKFTFPTFNLNTQSAKDILQHIESQNGGIDTGKLSQTSNSLYWIPYNDTTPVLCIPFAKISSQAISKRVICEVERMSLMINLSEDFYDLEDEEVEEAESYIDEYNQNQGDNNICGIVLEKIHFFINPVNKMETQDDTLSQFSKTLQVSLREIWRQIDSQNDCGSLLTSIYIKSDPVEMNLDKNNNNNNIRSSVDILHLQDSNLSPLSESTTSSNLSQYITSDTDISQLNDTQKSKLAEWESKFIIPSNITSQPIKRSFENHTFAEDTDILFSIPIDSNIQNWDSQYTNDITGDDGEDGDILHNINDFIAPDDENEIDFTDPKFQQYFYDPTSDKEEEENEGEE